MFYSNLVKVKASKNRTHAVDRLLVNASSFHNKTRNSLVALSYISSLLIGSQETPLLDRVLNASKDYVEAHITALNRNMTQDEAALVFSVLGLAMNRTADPHVKCQFLALVDKVITKAMALNTPPQLDSLKGLYSNYLIHQFTRTQQERKNNSPQNKAFLKQIRSTFKKLRTAAAAQIPFKTRVEFGKENRDEELTEEDKKHKAVTVFVHDTTVYNIEISARLNDWKVVTAKVKFGAEIKNSTWLCRELKICQETFVFSITLFPCDSPYPEITEEEAYRITPVLDITIHEPETGKQVSIKGLLQAALLEITITGNETAGGSRLVTRCHYFNETQKQWSMEDVHSLGIAGK